MPCGRTLACRARRVLHTAVMEQASRPSPPVEFMAMSPLISGLASVASLLFNASSSGRANAPRRSGGDTAPDQASAVVTLSPQAEALDTMVGKDGPLVIVDIEVPEDVLVSRLHDRRICGNCGWNATPGIARCERCGGPLVQRSDDGE